MVVVVSDKVKRGHPDIDVTVVTILSCVSISVSRTVWVTRMFCVVTVVMVRLSS